MNDHVKELAATPAIGISMQMQLDERRTIVFQGYVEADCSDEDMNARLDKLVRAGSRLQAQIDLVQARKHLAVVRKAFARAREDLATIDERYNHQKATAQASIPNDRRSVKERGIDSAQVQRTEHERQNALTTIERMKEDIAENEAKIAELEMMGA